MEHGQDQGRWPSPPSGPPPGTPQPPPPRNNPRRNRLTVAVVAAAVLGSGAGFGAVALLTGGDEPRAKRSGEPSAGKSENPTDAKPTPSPSPKPDSPTPVRPTETVTKYVSPPPEPGSQDEPDRIDAHPGGAAGAVPGSACTGRSDGRYDCKVGKTGGVSVVVPGTPDRRRGTIPQGRNWFVCQWTGPQKSYRQWTNHWWALTNSDQGGWGWVPVIYLTGGDDDKPVPGLPTCGSAEVGRYR